MQSVLDKYNLIYKAQAVSVANNHESDAEKWVAGISDPNPRAKSDYAFQAENQSLQLSTAGNSVLHEEKDKSSWLYF